MQYVRPPGNICSGYMRLCIFCIGNTEQDEVAFLGCGFGRSNPNIAAGTAGTHYLHVDTSEPDVGACIQRLPAWYAFAICQQLVLFGCIGHVQA
jgi:hypothetical protein